MPYDDETPDYQTEQDKDQCQCYHGTHLLHYIKHHRNPRNVVVCDVCGRQERHLQTADDRYVAWILNEEVLPWRYTVPRPIRDVIAAFTVEYCKKMKDYRIHTIISFGDLACSDFDSAKRKVDSLVDVDGDLASAVHPLHL